MSGTSVCYVCARFEANASTGYTIPICTNCSGHLRLKTDQEKEAEALQAEAEAQAMREEQERRELAQLELGDYHGAQPYVIDDDTIPF